MHNPFDHLGKNVLRDFFILFGTAQPAAEVPPTDALEIDLWYVPDPARERLRAEAASGVILEIAAEPAVLELSSRTLDERDLHASLRKRYQWQHVLELRDDKAWPLLRAWLTSTGKPQSVLHAYGFVQAERGPTGHYVTEKAAWRIHILVLRELPRTRETILLRILGRDQVLRDAIADLRRLPDDACEKRLALPWLSRLRFVVPPAALSDEEKALMTEIQDWFEQHEHRLQDEARQRGLDEGLDKGERLGLDRGKAQAIARLFERRLRRSLADGEHKALAERIERLGEDRVDDVLLGLDAGALVAWLADPAAS